MTKDRNLFIVAGVALAAVATAAHAEVAAPAAGHVRIGSWNISNLHAIEGQKPEGREAFSTARQTADYDWLAATAADISFDLVALQEIHSVEAVRRVFPAATYDVCFEDSRKAHNATLEVGKYNSIYTAVAIRKAFTLISCFESSELGIPHVDDGIVRNVRGGTGAIVQRGGQIMAFMSVHLKSSCSNAVINPPASDDCETLGKQIPILNQVARMEY